MLPVTRVARALGIFGVGPDIELSRMGAQPADVQSAVDRINTALINLNLAHFPARSAELSMSCPPPPGQPPVPCPSLRVPSIYDWTGFYLGINGGGAWGISSQNQILQPSQTTGNFDVSGGLVGGTIGFNLQIDQAVFGLEGDLDWANISGSTACRNTFTCTTQSDYLATARARLGYAFLNSWLAYVTGGAAFGNIDQSFFPSVGTSTGTISTGWDGPPVAD